MQPSYITHPTIFTIAGIKIQVVALTALTDTQAAKIAMRFYRSRKFTKKDQARLIQAITLFDQDSVGLL